MTPAPTAREPIAHASPNLLARASVLDLLLVAYYVALTFAAWQGGGAKREVCLARVAALLAAQVAMLLVVRADAVVPRWLAAALYRAVTFGGLLGSYFLLRDLLPVASPRAFDRELLALDVRLFGLEPTLALDRFVSPRTTEWFAFFYFLYFVLLAVHVLPMLLLCRNAALVSEFAYAIVLIYCVAHLLYMVVPGYGPYLFLGDRFTHALPAGTFHDLVIRTVEAGGAQKDIFPSLHTAGPVVIALFSLRHRRHAWFRRTWPIASFFAANIVGATIFLRWHYGVDVVAGFVLAVASVAMAARLSRWEEARRVAMGAETAWPALLPWRTTKDPPESSQGA